MEPLPFGSQKMSRKMSFIVYDCTSLSSSPNFQLQEGTSESFSNLAKVIPQVKKEEGLKCMEPIEHLF